MHRAVHDRSIARVLGKNGKIVLSDFDCSELRSITSHLDLTPSKNKNNRLTKQLRFEAWKHYHENNRTYQERCAQLSVSGVHLDQEEGAKEKWPLGTNIAKRFGNQRKPYVGTVQSIDKIWRVVFEDEQTEDFSISDMRIARCLYLTKHHNNYEDHQLRNELTSGEWPVGTEVLQSCDNVMKFGSVIRVMTYWRVVYTDDDDLEDLNEEEMKCFRKLYLKM